jgi:hypothetical protein
MLLGSRGSSLNGEDRCAIGDLTATAHQSVHCCDGRKGEGDYQGATSHAADRFTFSLTSRSALRVVAPWALFHFSILQIPQ